METAAQSGHLVRFEAFGLDLRTRRLHKHGLKLKLQGQPIEVLAMLLERPGELVTREELRRRLWPEGTFVDFEHSLNSAINRLREALGDNAEAPRYIETLPRLGYRFIAPGEPLTPGPSPQGRGEPEIVSVSQPSPAARGHPAPVSASQISPVEREWPGGRGEGAVTPVISPAKGGIADVAITATPRRLPVQKRWILAAMVGVPVTLLGILIGLNTAGLRDRVLRTVGAVREPPLQIQSIAVLPLENLSGDPEQEYFADGMTEELITNLGKISALRVISRTSVMRYKGTKKPLPEIAKELNVDALVEGTVLRSGNRVRVTANLLDARSDRHLWAESYERDLRDLLSLQDEVAQAITKEIQIKVTPQEQKRLVSSRPINPEAYEAYLKGQSHWYRVTPPQLETALEYFQLALEKDPNCALAYAGIANVWLTRGDWGVVPPREAYVNGEPAALKAIALDDTLAEGHYMAASFKYYYDWDWPGAEREYQTAIQINPNDADVRAFYWDLLMSMKRPEEAKAQIERAVELDPHNFFFQALLGQHWLFMRRYDGGIALLRKSLRMESDLSVAHRYLWGALYASGMQHEAVTEAKTYLGMMGNREAADALARGYAQAGYAAAMRLAAEKLAAPSKQTYVPRMLVARLYAHAGEKDSALKWLEKAYKEREPFMVSLNVDPFWNGLRSDPRFQDLVRRMNFPP